jgi:hypothetical protein
MFLLGLSTLLFLYIPQFAACGHEYVDYLRCYSFIFLNSMCAATSM